MTCVHYFLSGHCGEQCFEQIKNKCWSRPSVTRKNMLQLDDKEKKLPGS